MARPMTAGLCTSGGGRSKVTPFGAQFACLVERDKLPRQVHVDDAQIAFEPAPVTQYFEPAQMAQLGIARPAAAAVEVVQVPLVKLAVARSGDKGNKGDNVGVVMGATATRCEMPGLRCFNSVLANALDGGGTSSLYVDTQGKTYAQQLLVMPVKVPKSMLAHARRETKS